MRARSQRVKSQTIAIELSPARLEVGVVSRGRIVRCSGMLLDPNEWGRCWSDGLRSLDGRLAELLRGLGVREGARADVAHRGPDVAAEVYAFPMRGGQAVSAARMALADAVIYPLDEAAVDGAVIGVDKGGEPRQTHALASADTERGASAVVGWLRRAGLRPGRVVSSDALALACVVREALSGGTRAVVRLGDRGAAIAAGARGRLSFVRQTDVGVQHMVEALTRPLSAGGKQVRLTREEAAQLLHRVGLPEDEGAVVDEARGLRGADLLPALQPVLQRFLVDLKQSLRFGLDERDAQETAIELRGLGAGVPGLADLIGESTGLRVEARAEGTGEASAGAGAPDGDLRLMLRSSAAGASLLPRAERSARMAGAVKRGMLAGAAVGLAVVLLDAWGGLGELSAARAAQASAAKAAAQAEELLERQRAAEALGAEVARVEAAVLSMVGSRADWEAALLELSRLTPESVRLTEVRGEQDGGAPVLRFRGYVASPDAGLAARETLTAYFGALAGSPLVESAKLGATQRTELDGAGAMHFDGVVALLGAPVAHRSLLAGVGE